MESFIDLQKTASPEHGAACIFQRSYRLLIRAACSLQSPVLLAMRLYWGWQFFQTGKGKLMSHEKVTDFFQSLHIPFPGFNAWLAGGTECIGGLLLLIGLASRLVSLPLIFILTIAYLTAEIDSVKHIFGDPDKFVSAAPFLFLVATVVALAFGPGRYSVDWLLEKKRYGRNSQSQT